MRFFTRTLSTSMDLLRFLKMKKLLESLVSASERLMFVVVLYFCFDEMMVFFSEHPMVVSVFLNQGRKLHTTRSWDFLGLESNGRIRASSLWKKARFGEDTIIGNLDTG